MLNEFAQSDINGYASQTGQTFLPVKIIPAKAILTPGQRRYSRRRSVALHGPGSSGCRFRRQSATRRILTNMTDRADIKQFSSSWFWYNGTDDGCEPDAATRRRRASHSSRRPETTERTSSATSDLHEWQPGLPAVPLDHHGGRHCPQHERQAESPTGRIETAWVNSGGGIEASVPIPSEQVWIAGVNGASSSNRNVPDVSAMSNDINIFFNGASTNVGGTSLATPLWAGYMALVNELATNAGKHRASATPTPLFTPPQ